MRGLRWLGLGLPLAVPFAALWARQREARILRTGRALTEDEQAIARAMGVAQPERVRLLQLSRWPLPMRWFSRHVTAMALGHSICCVGDEVTPRLLAHELRHVQQVEAAGSLRNFLTVYLAEVARHGYWHAPLEVDARRAAQAYSDVAGRPS
ncbi:hypothetical protein [Ideonella sp. BN130291]|uniref:hypothetical protein n=1 Tax=Ideonella sp. BN130291 TaxID=3112940 RepID=UPI002E258A83|nr:hypothetical protein [Ideonella sp. BN130291]